MKHRFAIAALALVLGAAVVAAPAFARTVDFEGVQLELGASRADTMAALKTRFRVMSGAVTGYYNLYRKLAGDNGGGGASSLAIGSIKIHDDKLVAVTRNLGSFQSLDAQTAVGNFISAIAQAQDSIDHNHPRAEPTVHTKNTRVGDARVTEVYINYPDRLIQMAVYQPNDLSKTATVNVTEQYVLPDEDSPVAHSP